MTISETLFMGSKSSKMDPKSFNLAWKKQKPLISWMKYGSNSRLILIIRLFMLILKEMLRFSL